MIIDDISIKKTIAGWHLDIEAVGLRFTGEFWDFRGFLTAVFDAARYYAVAIGRFKQNTAPLTRPVDPRLQGAKSELA